MAYCDHGPFDVCRCQLEETILSRWGGDTCTCPDPVPLIGGMCGYCRRKLRE